MVPRFNPSNATLNQSVGFNTHNYYLIAIIITHISIPGISKNTAKLHTGSRYSNIKDNHTYMSVYTLADLASWLASYSMIITPAFVKSWIIISVAALRFFIPLRVSINVDHDLGETPLLLHNQSSNSSTQHLSGSW